MKMPWKQYILKTRVHLYISVCGTSVADASPSRGPLYANSEISVRRRGGPEPGRIGIPSEIAWNESSHSILNEFMHAEYGIFVYTIWPLIRAAPHCSSQAPRCCCAMAAIELAMLTLHVAVGAERPLSHVYEEGTDYQLVDP